MLTPICRRILQSFPPLAQNSYEEWLNQEVVSLGRPRFMFAQKEQDVKLSEFKGIHTDDRKLMLLVPIVPVLQPPTEDPNRVELKYAFVLCASRQPDLQKYFQPATVALATLCDKLASVNNYLTTKGEYGLVNNVGVATCRVCGGKRQELSILTICGKCQLARMPDAKLTHVQWQQRRKLHVELSSSKSRPQEELEFKERVFQQALVRCALTVTRTHLGRHGVRPETNPLERDFDGWADVESIKRYYAMKHMVNYLHHLAEESNCRIALFQTDCLPPPLLSLAANYLNSLQ